MTDIFETKANFSVTETGEITGIAWVFGSPDRTGDRINKGAFSAANAPVPMLDTHNQREPIGAWHSVTETDKGLEVKGQLLINDVPRAREVHALVKAGGIRGLSIGGIFKDTKRLPGGGRSVGNVDLGEISLVAFPAHPGAQITSFKNHSNSEGNISMDTETVETEANAEVKNHNDLETKVAELSEELATVRKAHDNLAVKLARPGVVTTKSADDTAEMERKAFRDFVNGDTKALSTTGDSGNKGGALAPDSFVAQVQRKLIEASPFRQFASTMTIGAPAVELPVQTSNVAGAWVGENEARSATDMGFDTLKIEAFGWGGYVDISNDLIADSQVDVMSIIADDFGKQAAKAEGLAFLDGDGTKKPTGILRNASIDVTEANSDTALTINELLDLSVVLPREYSQTSAFYMNRHTRAAIRKLALNDAPDAWGDSLSATTPSTLFGFPIHELPDLPSIEAESIPVIFGDLAQTFRVVDRAGLTLLSDPYTQAATNMTRVHVNRRVGGAVLNAAACAFLQMAEDAG